MEWFVVHTQFNKEIVSENNLIRQGFETYMPKYKKIINHARKRRLVSRPLFPRYLFVKNHNKNMSVSSISSTHGVSTIVSMDGKPAQISNNIINQIKSNENNEGIIDIKPFFNKTIGEEVEIVEGAFTGKLGIFNGINEDNRVKVLFNILGKEITLSMSALALA